MTGEALKVWGLSPELGLLAGTLFAAPLGWVFGALAIKRQGIYFAMVTLALAQLVYFAAVQSDFTGGEDGLQSVPRGRLFGAFDLSNDLAMYYVVLSVVGLALAAVYRIVHSPFGQVLAGIKGNPERAISLGYDIRRAKLLAFVLSAALSGLAGSLKTLRNEELPPIDRMKAYVDAQIDHIKIDNMKNGCLFGNFAAEATEQSERIRVRLNEIFAEVQKSIEFCLKAAVKSGDIAPRRDFAELASFIIASLQGSILMSKTERSAKPVERFRQMLFSTILRK